MSAHWASQTGVVLANVMDERLNQHEKWGEQNCSDFEWVSILTEEVGEAAAEANEANFESGNNRGDFTKLRAELVQVAAVAVAWVEAIDRRPVDCPDCGGYGSSAVAGGYTEEPEQEECFRCSGTGRVTP